MKSPISGSGWLMVVLPTALPAMPLNDDGVEFGLGDRDAARVGEAPRRVVPSVDPAADRRPRLPSL